MFKWIKDNILWEALCVIATNAIAGGAMIALPPAVLGFWAKLDGFPPSMIALFVLCGGVYSFWLRNELCVLYQQLQQASFSISFSEDARFVTSHDGETTWHFLLTNTRNDLGAIRDCNVCVVSIVPTAHQIPNVSGPPPTTDTSLLPLPQIVKSGFVLNAGQSIRVPFMSYEGRDFVYDQIKIRGSHEWFYARTAVPYTVRVLVTGAGACPLSVDFVATLNDDNLSISLRRDE